jgi:hypothetical protein
MTYLLAIKRPGDFGLNPFGTLARRTKGNRPMSHEEAVRGMVMTEIDWLIHI